MKKKKKKKKKGIDGGRRATAWPFTYEIEKRLVQFALSGSSALEQYAILLVRVSLGLFFAISGANKLVCRQKQANYVRNAR